MAMTALTMAASSRSVTACRARSSGRSCICRTASASGRTATNSRCRSRRSRCCTPSACSACSMRRRARVSVHQHALGELELQRAGIDSRCAASARCTSSTQRAGARTGAPTGSRAQRRLQPGVAPGAQLAAGGVEHPVADRQDQAGFLGQRDEVRPADSSPRCGCCQRSSASQAEQRAACRRRSSAGSAGATRRARWPRAGSPPARTLLPQRGPAAP